MTSWSAHRSQQISAVVAEDEPILCADLQSRLKSLWPELQIVGQAANGMEALRLFELHHPEVLFLDIEMPGISGLQIAQQLSGRCHVVFITAYDSYAVEAFDQGAIDYVLKPYDNTRLALAIQRVRQRLTAVPPPMDDLLREMLLAVRPKEYLRWIKASRGTEVDLIIVGEVCYFQANAKYTCVYTATRESHIRRSIKELAAELDPSTFWQIHRSTIVNLEAIQSITRSFSEVSVKLRSRREYLPVSKAYKHLFRQM
jgi:DNA-binding LytR/AlgR family response regulator